MNRSRPTAKTVGVIDEEANYYRSIFNDVRQYECFKWLLVGILSILPRKSLPGIAKLAGLKDGQNLNHFLRESSWSVEALRELRLKLIRQLIGIRPIILCIDETGDVKKGASTDYVAKQYIGNLGKTANGMVSVNAYAVVDGLTYPLLFKVCKPRSRLKEGEKHKTKTQLAVEILREVHGMGFVIEMVLADSFYGESRLVIRLLENELKLPYIVAIRSNHGRIMMPGHRIHYNRWRAYGQPLENHPTQRRYMREIIFGERFEIRYFQITRGATDKPEKTKSWSIMTNLPGKIIPTVAIQYSWRNWIEYGCKQVKNELGWHDYQLTDYSSIERWWELIFIAYLIVTIQAEEFKNKPNRNDDEGAAFAEPWSQHPHWESGCNWKSTLNNLHLLIQLYWCWAWIESWLCVFPIPGLRRAIQRLRQEIDHYRICPRPTSYTLRAA